MSAPLVGRLDAFDENVESWTSYVERVEEYFVLNNLQEDKKVAALITSMGAKTYNTLRKLTCPKKPSELKFNEIKKYLTDYFSPTPLEMSERHRFYNRLQGQSESATHAHHEGFDLDKGASRSGVIRILGYLRRTGVDTVQVKFREKCSRLQLYVARIPGPALFGREWIQEFKLLEETNGIFKTPTATTASQEEVKTKLNQILETHKVAFEDSIGKLNGIKASLNLKENVQPEFLRARQVPYILKEKVFAALDRLESEGILTKVNVTEWATPIVPVVKPNGTVRICGDFKSTINQHLVVDQYPLPLVEDIFAKLSGGQIYTKIDLRQAFLQMEVDEKSKHLLTIHTEKGLFRYNRMVFAIAPAPAIWQRTIEQVLQGVPMTHATQDDIVVSGTTEEDHLENLSKVLMRLESFGLKANLQKCSFFQDSIVYCGYKISSEGLHKTQDKIRAVLEAPAPQNVSQLRSFLGLINHSENLYRTATFARTFGKICEVEVDKRLQSNLPKS
ncbi:uncharacterized protein K02A2.6-like [Ornithodoros turicata]|uniref:uncharacterized protein K02A2.6-like n=1 Tax=Ornithodoros turicata TaxID=34597 RepID=UPI003138FBE1